MVRTNPVSSDTNVPVNVVVSLEVDEPLDPGTVNSNSFILRDNATSQDVAGSRSVSADGRTISFVPDTALAVGRPHQVIFSTSILDLAGNPLTGSNFFFTTDFVADTVGPQVVG